MVGVRKDGHLFHFLIAGIAMRNQETAFFEKNFSTKARNTLVVWISLLSSRYRYKCWIIHGIRIREFDSRRSRIYLISYQSGNKRFMQRSSSRDQAVGTYIKKLKSQNLKNK